MISQHKCEKSNFHASAPTEKMFLALLLFCVVYKNFEVAAGISYQKYCVIGAEEPAIFLNSTEGKDRSYSSSSFVHSTVLDFINNPNENWTVVESSEDPNEFRLGIVLDWRWEHFPDNINNRSQLISLLQHGTNNGTFFSIKVYEELGSGQNGWLRDQANVDHGWIHLYNSSALGLAFFNLSDNKFLPIKDDVNLWKLYTDNPKWIWKWHKYEYLWTDSSHTTKILNFTGSDDENGSTKERTFIIFIFVAMCNNCEITFEIRTEIANYTENFEGIQYWKEVEIALDFTPQLFSLWATTLNTSNDNNSYWAIGDIRYSNCLNDIRFIQYEATEDTHGCELVSDSSPITPVEQVPTSCIIATTATNPSTSTNEPTFNTSVEIIEEFHRILTDEESLMTTGAGNSSMGKLLQAKFVTTKSTPTNDVDDNLSQTGFNFLYLTPVLMIVFAIAGFILGMRLYKRRGLSGTLLLPSDEELKRLETTQSDVTLDEPPTSVMVERFPAYVKSILDNDLEILRKQFQSISSESWLCKEGLKTENRSKNRKGAGLPYDDTRVLLAPYWNSASNSSNYINASYVGGFQDKHEYILTQNPISTEKVSTMADFWHMVWQSQIEYIVMIGSQLDNDEYDQYWPELGQQIEHGDIEIFSENVEEYDDYFVERLMEVKYLDQRRKIRQYHCTRWSSSGRPTFPFKLLTFVDKILKTPHDGSPILIHSKRGIGRSGVVVLCDIALRSCQITGKIDILQTLQKLRRYRTNVIENLEQFKLAHLVILEYLIGKDTTVDLTQEFANQNKMLSDQWTYINRMKWIDEAVIPQNYVNSISWKNRYDDCLPGRDWGTRSITGFDPDVNWQMQFRMLHYHTSDKAELLSYISYKIHKVDPLCTKYTVAFLKGATFVTDKISSHSRVVLKHISPNYINATYVNGYARRKFITAQQPLPKTLQDFWIMLLQNKVNCIVNLNEIDEENEFYSNFWPTENRGLLKPLPDVEVKYVRSKNFGNFENFIVDVSQESKFYDSIVIYSVKDWFSSDSVPKNPETLLHIWKELSTAKRKESSNVLVTCDDGLTGCGLFVCLFYLLDKIQKENRCDLVEAVRSVRISHNKFINMKQFVFLYDCALQHFRARKLLALKNEQ